MKFLSSIALAFLALVAVPAAAQVTYPTVSGAPKAAGAVILQCDSGVTTCTPVTSTAPLNVAVSSGTVTSSGSSTVTGNVASAATDSGNPVKVGGVFPAAIPTFTSGQRGDLQLGSRGSLAVTVMGLNSSSGAPVNQVNADGVSATNQALAVQSFNNVYNGASWDRAAGNTSGSFTLAKPTTTGGLTYIRLVAATNGVIKASGGQIYTASLTNSNAAIRYLQIYNKTTAGTLSTDTPVITVPLPPNVTVRVDFSDIGAAFGTGISWQFTTDDVAIPTTAGATTDIHGFVAFK